MTQASTADLLAGYVHAVGVRHIFGYPGESVIDFMEAARHQGIELVSAVREGTAAFMAEAAAMATGLPGVCLSTLGPGSTAVLNGVAAAMLDRVPVLAVSGQIESSREQFFTHQVVDHGRMFAPVTKLAAASGPGLGQHGHPQGAAHRGRRAPGGRPPDRGRGRVVRARSRPAAVVPPPLAPAAGSVDVYGDGDPLRVLHAARRPVLLAGPAALRCAAGPDLVRLAELAGLPVVVSPMAKGIFPEDHPYFAGVLDMAGHRVIWDLLAGADLIVAAGFDPVELISPWSVARPSCTWTPRRTPTRSTPARTSWSATSGPSSAGSRHTGPGRRGGQSPRWRRTGPGCARPGWTAGPTARSTPATWCRSPARRPRQAPS